MMVSGVSARMTMARCPPDRQTVALPHIKSRPVEPPVSLEPHRGRAGTRRRGERPAQIVGTRHAHPVDLENDVPGAESRRLLHLIGDVVDQRAVVALYAA